MRQTLDKCINDITLPRWEAVKNVLSHCSFRRRTEYVPYYEAYGRILSEDVYSDTTLPNALTASRDGIAVYFDRFEGGTPDTSKWAEGVDYVYSNTGVGIPGDYDTEILIEKVYKDENGAIRIDEAPKYKGENTIPAGDELKQGELLAKAGQTVTPALAAVLAKGGHVVFPVVAKPVVSFIPTGNELVPAGIPVPARKNMDSNSVLMRGKLLEWGAIPQIYPICPDDRDQLRSVLRDAVECSDIVILNAGSSKGTDDIGHEVIEELGTMLNHQVDTGPGKHSCYAVIQGKPVIGLSGPTVGCDVSGDWYAKPVIDAYFGKPAAEYPRFKAKTLTALATNTKICFMMPAHVMLDENEMPVVAPQKSLPADVRSETKINCFIPMQEFRAKAGDMVEIELKPPFISPVKELDLIARIPPDEVVK